MHQFLLLKNQERYLYILKIREYSCMTPDQYIALYPYCAHSFLDKQLNCAMELSGFFCQIVMGAISVKQEFKGFRLIFVL